ncbi:regulatory protein [Thermolongibacillus altinsuensis]|jgi:regulatory protein|uniref:Regulatory protein RecX n=1 Tax=Thermolongibacillus altinsuensis TaxID=575256 RepID=A0A4R1QB57_9BACL|nr:recombination regulator RecX [Thermolongibacillus altinsuensis]TCL46772.1 regulatory protein [Thermolongibacillus altinsuensis]
MILITKIAVEKNNHERFRIYVDRGDGKEYMFTVDQDVLIQFQLKKGKEISEEQLNQMLYEDLIKQAYQMSLRFLSYRMRSEKEVRDFLHKKNVPHDVIEKVLHTLRQNRYVDDQQFAIAYVQTQKKTTWKGPQLIYKELLEKGVEQEIIEEAITQYLISEQIEKAKKWIEKVRKQSKKRSEKEQKMHVVQTLKMKGFTQEVIDEVSKEIQQDEQSEWEALQYYGQKAHRRYEKYEGYTYEQKMKQALYRKGFSMEMIEEFLQKIKEEQ